MLFFDFWWIPTSVATAWFLSAWGVYCAHNTDKKDKRKPIEDTDDDTNDQEKNQKKDD